MASAPAFRQKRREKAVGGCRQPAEWVCASGHATACNQPGGTSAWSAPRNRLTAAHPRALGNSLFRRAALALLHCAGCAPDVRGKPYNGRLTSFPRPVKLLSVGGGGARALDHAPECGPEGAAPAKVVAGVVLRGGCHQLPRRPVAGAAQGHAVRSARPCPSQDTPVRRLYACADRRRTLRPVKPRLAWNERPKPSARITLKLNELGGWGVRTSLPTSNRAKCPFPGPSAPLFETPPSLAQVRPFPARRSGLAGVAGPLRAVTRQAPIAACGKSRTRLQVAAVSVAPGQSKRPSSDFHHGLIGPIALHRTRVPPTEWGARVRGLARPRVPRRRRQLPRVFACTAAFRKGNDHRSRATSPASSTSRPTQTVEHTRRQSYVAHRVRTVVELSRTQPGRRRSAVRNAATSVAPRVRTEKYNQIVEAKLQRREIVYESTSHEVGVALVLGTTVSAQRV